jgi:hypothetical protein
MRRTTIRRATRGLVFGVALVINPGLGCGGGSGEEDPFDYGEAEMQAFVLGDWAGTMVIDGEEHAFVLTLEQATADGADLEPNGVGLEGTLTADDARLVGTVSGSVMAFSSLDSAGLDLDLEGGGFMTGSLSSEGLEGGSANYFGSEGSAWSGTFTLARP